MNWSDKKKTGKLPKCHFCGEMCVKNYISHYSFALCFKCRKILTKYLEIEIWVMGSADKKRPKGKRF